MYSKARVAAVVTAVLGLFNCTLTSAASEIPTDDTIIAIFAVHKNELQVLRDMATEDMNTTSAISESHISESLPEERRRRYEARLKIYPKLVIGVDHDGRVRFIFASAGEAIGAGWAKGIMFVPHNTKAIGTKVENLERNVSIEGLYLRDIGSDWFLFYQKDD